MPKPRRLSAPLPAETQTPASVTDLTLPAHQPKYKRLSDDQRVAILKLAKLDKTQADIAHTVGCDQASVCRWLNMNRDSSEAASSLARGQSLRMMSSVIRYGKPADHINVLKGIGVLQDQQNVGLSIHIGGHNTDVKILTLSSRNESDATS